MPCPTQPYPYRLSQTWLPSCMCMFSSNLSPHRPAGERSHGNRSGQYRPHLWSQHGKVYPLLCLPSTEKEEEKKKKYDNLPSILHLLKRSNIVDLHNLGLSYMRVWKHSLDTYNRSPQFDNFLLFTGFGGKATQVKRLPSSVCSGLTLRQTSLHAWNTKPPAFAEIWSRDFIVSRVDGTII